MLVFAGRFSEDFGEVGIDVLAAFGFFTLVPACEIDETNDHNSHEGKRDEDCKDPYLTYADHGLGSLVKVKDDLAGLALFHELHGFLELSVVHAVGYDGGKV